MRITDKGSIDTGVSQLVRGGSSATGVRGKSEDRQAVKTNDAAQVSISAEARKLQKVVALAGRGDEMRAEKVQQLKEQIENGTYQVDAMDVAKSIVRHDVGHLLGKQ
jgi:negative regulator of flagellin synthesis FlgM